MNYTLTIKSVMMLLHVNVNESLIYITYIYFDSFFSQKWEVTENPNSSEIIILLEKNIFVIQEVEKETCDINLMFESIQHQ